MVKQPLLWGHTGQSEAWSLPQTCSDVKQRRQAKVLHKLFSVMWNGVNVCADAKTHGRKPCFKNYLCTHGAWDLTSVPTCEIQTHFHHFGSTDASQDNLISGPCWRTTKLGGLNQITMILFKWTEGIKQQKHTSAFLFLGSPPVAHPDTHSAASVRPQLRVSIKTCCVLTAVNRCQTPADPEECWDLLTSLDLTDRKDLRVLGAELMLRFLEVQSQRLKFSTPIINMWVALLVCNKHWETENHNHSQLRLIVWWDVCGAALRLYDGQKQTGADQNILTDTEDNFSFWWTIPQKPATILSF